LPRATLGTLPPLSLADARDLAREALRQAALGHDPGSARREAPEALTVAGLVKQYIESGQGRRSAAANADYGRTLSGLIQPSILGPRVAQELSRGELRRFLESVARKTPIRANRALVLIRAAFRWGLREGLIERDPTAGMQRPRPERPRERVLADNATAPCNPRRRTSGLGRRTSRAQVDSCHRRGVRGDSLEAYGPGPDFPQMEQRYCARPSLRWPMSESSSHS
jgi:hypothetical protein